MKPSAKGEYRHCTGQPSNNLDHLAPAYHLFSTQFNSRYSVLIPSPRATGIRDRRFYELFVATHRPAQAGAVPEG